MSKSLPVDGIVKNGFDFFRKSLAEINNEPKFSVLHFFAAVELFLKARLMAEHWSLVVSKDPSWDAFERGDFKSVTLEECLSRLANVARSPVPQDDIRRFKQLAKHRNKIVHFHHEIDHPTAVKVQREIAAELCGAWRSLYILLTQNWISVFKHHVDELKRLDSQMRKYRDYLQAIFERQAEQLKQEAASGERIDACASCGFTADHVEVIVGGVHDHHCSVCNYKTRTLATTCPACDGPIEVEDGGFGTCPHCAHDIEPNELAQHIQENSGSLKDDLESGYPAHCAHCSGVLTVVPYEGSIVCASCYQTYESTEIQQCGWCSDMNAGDMAHSFVMGCVACEGSVGHHSSKED